MTKPIEGEEDLWATFGMLYPKRMLAQVALDDELAGLEAKPPAAPPDPYAFETDAGAEYQMLSPTEVETEVAKRKAEEAKAKAAAQAEAGEEPAAEEGEPLEPLPPAPAPPNLTPVEKAAKLLPKTYGGKACLSALVAPIEIATRVTLASCCLSYHEKHEKALAVRALAEHETLEKQLTRELDERLMAHRPRAGHVETDMAAQRDMELLAHRERFVRHVKTLTARRLALAQSLEEQVAECAREEEKHIVKLKASQRALGSERNNHTATLQRLSREAEAAHAVYTEFMQECYDGLKAKADASKKEVLNQNEKFRSSWVPFMDGGQFNEVERDRFVERLAKVDEEATSEAEKQDTRLGGLQEEQLARAADALEEFRAAFAVNLEDITHIEVMKMQQGKATADVRIVLAESAAQETSIDNQEKILGELLNKFKRGGSAPPVAAIGAPAAAPDGSAESALSMKILHAGEKMRQLLLQRANFLHVLQATAVPTSCAPIIGPSTRASRGRGARCRGSKGRCGACGGHV